MKRVDWCKRVRMDWAAGPFARWPRRQVLRAFRVLRLFGRLKSLRNIVAAITESIVPVLNAFLIIYLVASICAAQIF